MSQSKITVAAVTEFTDPGDPQDATFRLENAGPFVVPRKDRRFKVWSQMLTDRKLSGKLVYAETDGNMLKTLLLPSERQIEDVAAKPDGDKLQVIILMAPSVYHLKTTHPNYAAMKQALEKAKQSQDKILVTSHPDTQEILDVRPVPGPAKQP